MIIFVNKMVLHQKFKGEKMFKAHLRRAVFGNVERRAPRVFLVLVALQIGCTSRGFNRGELSQQFTLKAPAYDDAKIRSIASKKPNLPKPFRVGVYFATPTIQADKAQWRWTDQDKRILDEVGRELKAQGLISDFFPILDTFVEARNLASLRVVAARHAADAVLVINGTGQVDRYFNPAGLSYFLVLPALFVPGSQAETLFMANASLWDVRNEYLYLTAEAEATSNKRYVAAFRDEDKELVENTPLRQPSKNQCFKKK